MPRTPDQPDDALPLLRMLEDKLKLEQAFGADAVSVKKKGGEPGAPPPESQRAAGLPSRHDETPEEPVIPPHQHEAAAPSRADETGLSKADRLKALEDEEKACRECPLYKTRKNFVFGVGSAEAELMFVGEAPGADEDEQGEPFVGRAGQLLTKMIEAMGMKRSDVYIANILKCRPPENRTPQPMEIVHCLPILRRQIEIIKPKLLVCLGAIAAHTLLQSGLPVGAMRGHFHDYRGTKLLVTFHPAYLLRKPEDKGLAWDDMKMVLKFLGKPIPAR